QDRLIMRLLNEAAACLREKVVEDEDLIDAGVIFGTGFAPFRGGPIHHIRAEGVSTMSDRLAQLKSRYGDRFAADAGWSNM
ncbi:MAG TPA: 3-hydroxyacyl-CoA dehydrogenase, partial [Gammaproteobacteria bacterium]|nr:3-hydroxyacyl-CoA dehydrogenase [Gammaproteobacteria bacterium]